MPTIISGNGDGVAESIITTTLLNSMRTNNPIIDAVTSLVVMSDFKNKWTKNMYIVASLVAGLLANKLSKKINISYIYSFFQLYDLTTMVKYIPSKYLRNQVLKIRGSEVNIQINNSNDIENIKTNTCCSPFLIKYLKCIQISKRLNSIIYQVVVDWRMTFLTGLVMMNLFAKFVNLIRKLIRRIMI